MKILITGREGQLGKEIRHSLVDIHNDELISFGRHDMDVTNFLQVEEMIVRERPQVIIHTAAYTNVDGAEREPESAFSINAVGTRNVSVVAEKIGAKLCYISTDYVFDGKKEGPYNEFDHANPLNVYGRSKLAGEQLVLSLCRRYFIVRTSWLYGLYGKNFITTMLELAKKHNTIQVVSDQYGAPTYTKDLANFLYQLVKTERFGVYHASNAGECSWFSFAKTIFEKFNVDVYVEAVSSKQYLRPAMRPAYSVMDNMALRLNEFTPFRSWQDALAEYVSEYNSLKRQP